MISLVVIDAAIVSVYLNKPPFATNASNAECRMRAAGRIRLASGFRRYGKASAILGYAPATIETIAINAVADDSMAIPRLLNLLY